MEDEKIYTLQLTQGEVLMLQELTEDLDCCYAWMLRLATSLRAKAMEAYQKPELSREAYAEQMEASRRKWQGLRNASPLVVDTLVHVDECKLRFYNKVEEGEERYEE